MADRKPPPDAKRPAGSQTEREAYQTLVLLNEQADTLRADLAALRADLAQVEHDFKATPGAILREANEQLVVAAMKAEAIAETATHRLGELARAGVDDALVAQARLVGPLVDQGALDLREANERLVIAALNSQELEMTALEAHRRQIAFLATVAHELRNPLMPLRLAALMLDRARTDDVAHAKLQATITGQVAQMARLIGDLLDGSRISTGKFRLERTQVDLVVVLERVIETCQPAMDTRGHSFTRDIPPGPIMVLGDTVRLVQVFGNLLENSSKYTPEGDGKISLIASVRGGAVIVTTRDNGIGITPQALPHVFDMFVRDTLAAESNQGGLGIGLAVVRELVKAHEGTVVAKSGGKDRGSEFIVSLPLAAAIRRSAAPTL
ncbi:MAG TPA: HAMP domain-containing sensor histidine kinase [Ramlibacter sp.]|nr:HAMP domain-containing sensor histidine kinase [Ramlibacter sp.]